MKQVNKDIKYIEELTAIRGLAAWWVVAYHFRQYLDPHIPSWFLHILDKGYLAVDFFFILSGFVIFISNSNIVLIPKIKNIKYFYFKRMARIYPLHLVTLIAAAAYPIAVYVYSGNIIAQGRYSPDAFLANILLIHDWGLFDVLTWNVPSWSISAEFLSYLCFPAMVFLIMRIKQLPCILILSCVFSLISLALIANFLSLKNIGDKIPDFGVIRCFFQFFIGCILAHLFLNYRDFLERYRSYFESITLIGIGIYFTTNLPDYWTMPLTFSAIIVSIALGRNVYSAILGTKILQIAGFISYSTYMLHFIVLDWYKALFVKEGQDPSLYILLGIFVFIFIISYISYQLIEVRLQVKIRNHFKLNISINS